MVLPYLIETTWSDQTCEQAMRDLLPVAYSDRQNSASFLIRMKRTRRPRLRSLHPMAPSHKGDRPRQAAHLCPPSKRLACYNLHLNLEFSDKFKTNWLTFSYLWSPFVGNNAAWIQLKFQ